MSDIYPRTKKVVILTENQTKLKRLSIEIDKKNPTSPSLEHIKQLKFSESKDTSPKGSRIRTLLSPRKSNSPRKQKTNIEWRGEDIQLIYENTKWIQIKHNSNIHLVLLTKKKKNGSLLYSGIDIIIKIDKPLDNPVNSKMNIIMSYTEICYDKPLFFSDINQVKDDICLKKELVRIA